MENKNSYINDILEGIGVIFLYLSLSAFMSYFINLFGISFNNLSNTFKQIYLIFCECSITILILYIYKKDFIPNFKDFKSNIKKYIDKYLKYWFMMLCLMITSNIIVTLFTTTKVANNQSNIVSLLGKYPVYTAIVTIICAPILEELIFRLSIRKLFRNDTLFILMSGLIFGSLHVVGNFDKLIDLLFIIPYSIPGFIFAYVYTKSKNICVPMGIHFIHNTVMILLQLLITIL